MSEIIELYEYHIDNDNYIILRQYNLQNKQEYNIIFYSNASRHYCDEPSCKYRCICKDSDWIKGLWNSKIFYSNASRHYCDEPSCKYRCICKDSDWIKGLWNSKIFYSNETDLEYMTNFYNFLVNQSLPEKSSLFKLNQKKLYYWLKDNIYLFLEIYHSDIILYIKNKIELYISRNIFTEDFFRNIKYKFYQKYEDFHKYINETLSIKYDFQKDKIIIHNNINQTDIYIDNNNNNNIKSLQIISLDTINEISNIFILLEYEYNFNILNDENIFILNNIYSYITIIKNYLNIQKYLDIEEIDKNDLLFYDYSNTITYIIDNFQTNMKLDF